MKTNKREFFSNPKSLIPNPQHLCLLLTLAFLLSCSQDTIDDLLGSSSGTESENSSSSGNGSEYEPQRVCEEYEESDSKIQLDIVIRDFPVGYYGFEEFDVDYGNNGVCANADGSIVNILSNKICFDGDGNYITCDKGGTPLKYGADNCDGPSIRGFTNGPDMQINNVPCWENEIWVTKGMVQNTLNYEACKSEDLVGDAGDPMHIRGRNCARPMPNNGLCYGENLHEWFTNGGYAKTIHDIMILERVDNSSVYQINYDYNTSENWNGYGYDNGYFPLDKYSDNLTWGKQSLNVWCPASASYDLGDDCRAWKSNGGPKDPNAAIITAASRSIMHKLHNYGFTIAGSGEFKYASSASDIIEFIGDDDMWIFIDGELAMDLGGVHNTVPGKINIGSYGRDKGWAEGSKHVFNFFYTERNTDGSNLNLRIALTDLTPPTCKPSSN